MATVSVANEYLAWDNVETLFVTRNVDGQPQRRITLSYGLRVNPRLKISGFSSVRTTAKHESFWLPIAEFGSGEPDGNMVIEDSDNVKYAVDGSTDPLHVRYGNAESHWSVLCVRYQDEP